MRIRKLYPIKKHDSPIPSEFFQKLSKLSGLQKTPNSIRRTLTDPCPPSLPLFPEFEDPRDADDAIYGRDGYDFDGVRLRVELAHGGRHSSSDRYRSYSRSSSSRGVSRRSDYRVLVTGLPPSVSWQDPKDHMRRAGDVCFSQVFRDRGEMPLIALTYGWGSMILSVAIPEAPVMAIDGATLEAPVVLHICQEVQVSAAAIAMVAGAEAYHRRQHSRSRSRSGCCGDLGTVS
ncbi:uncharacterized protein LOC126618293 [Malus sylvestris]|uniref:uncharacterized protein LOC126618293 n=1 Tax=Malus sylvestris TaxID=3752 RepID=UPI0021AD11DD|nr:uncharacterized protein LOC126618293 [Malus sylvestris]